MNELCNGCGDCCRVVTLPYSKAVFQQMLDRDIEVKFQAPGYTDAQRTLDWIMNDLTEITLEEARERLPSLQGERLGQAFYKCAKFDETNNRCTDHENRPGVCRGFPGYDGPVYTHYLISYPTCGYWEVAVDPIDIDTGTVQGEA